VSDTQKHTKVTNYFIIFTLFDTLVQISFETSLQVVFSLWFHLPLLLLLPCFISHALLHHSLLINI